MDFPKKKPVTLYVGMCIVLFRIEFFLEYVSKRC